MPGLLEKVGGWAIVVAWALSPSQVWAADPAITVACPAWAAESTAEVEARIRTILLTELPAGTVRVACGSADTASVAVTAGTQTREATVQHQATRLEDDIVAGVSKVVEDLAAESNAKPAAADFPEAAAAPPPEPAPPPERAPNKAVPQAPPPSPAPPVAAASTSELTAGGMFETWGTNGDGAVGARLGLSTHRRRFRYGIGASWATALGVPATFRAQEWRLQGRLGLDLGSKTGLTLGAAIGVGILVASPQSGVSPVSGTALSAGSLEVSLARPGSLGGGWALVPSGAMLVHSARRDIRVNTVEQLTEPIFVANFALLISYEAR